MSSKPSIKNSLKCDCPICPLIKYGKNIEPGTVVVYISDPDQNNKITCSLSRPKEISSIPQHNLIKLVLFARNNHKLQRNNVLKVDVGNAVINIAHYAENSFGISLDIYKSIKHHEMTLNIYSME